MIITETLINSPIVALQVVNVKSQWQLPSPEISTVRPINVMITTICGWSVSGYEFLFVSGGSDVWYLRFDECHWDSQWPHEGAMFLRQQKPANAKHLPSTF